MKPPLVLPAPTKSATSRALEGAWLRPSPARVRALIVDLNNFSTFPTLAVGLLVASLRNAGHDAEVLSPLAFDVPAAARERREWVLDDWRRRLHLGQHPLWIGARDLARQVRMKWSSRPHPRALRAVRQALDKGPDVLLLSAYLHHQPTVRVLARLAAARGIPVLLGGPAFNLPETVEAWRGIEGVSAIVGGEVDLSLPAITEALLAGEDLLQFPGVVLPDGRRSRPAPPLRDLDRVPVPDFTDFPWDRYATRIVPVMASRGCQWAECTFCNDIHTASGRTFRTRSAGVVLHEMEEQARRHATSNFLFLDLKLNSNPALLRALSSDLQRRVPGAQWIGTVHVDLREDNGLSRHELRAAAAAGLRRLSFGLETGSQRLLDAMGKGTTVDALSRFVREAHAAGISLRATMFRGYPGEEAQDLRETLQFLQEHSNLLDRVRFNELSVPEGSALYTDLMEGGGTATGLLPKGHEQRGGRLRYRERDSRDPEYRSALSAVLGEVHRINRRPLRSAARQFDGMM